MVCLQITVHSSIVKTDFVHISEQIVSFTASSGRSRAMLLALFGQQKESIYYRIRVSLYFSYYTTTSEISAI